MVGYKTTLMHRSCLTYIIGVAAYLCSLAAGNTTLAGINILGNTSLLRVGGVAYTVLHFCEDV